MIKLSHLRERVKIKWLSLAIELLLREVRDVYNIGYMMFKGYCVIKKHAWIFNSIVTLQERTRIVFTFYLDIHCQFFLPGRFDNNEICFRKIK